MSFLATIITLNKPNYGFLVPECDGILCQYRRIFFNITSIGIIYIVRMDNMVNNIDTTLFTVWSNMAALLTKVLRCCCFVTLLWNILRAVIVKACHLRLTPHGLFELVQTYWSCYSNSHLPSEFKKPRRLLFKTSSDARYCNPSKISSQMRLHCFILTETNAFTRKRRHI